MAGKEIPHSEQIQAEIDRRKAWRAKMKALLWIVPKEAPGQTLPSENTQKVGQNETK